MAEKRKKHALKASRSPDAGLDIFKDPEANWLLNRTMAFMDEKCAEIGECLYTARRIKALDETSEDVWRDEWAALAQRVEQIAEEAFRKGHAVSAREAFLRASNYYRTAEYCTRTAHPQFEPLWRKSASTFARAAGLFDPPIQLIQVRYDERDLPGYFWRPDHCDVTRPTLIACGGGDSSLEELVYWVGMAAVRRGYNFFAFDHPGHRGAVHLYPDMVKIPDYENPYQAAIDYLLTLPGVDERLVMTGYSFGGYVTLRVAAFDVRIQAIAPNPAITHNPFQQRELRGIWEKIPIQWIDRLVAKGMQKKPTVNAWMDFIYRSCGFPYERWSEILEINRIGFSARAHLHRITCPTLLLVGEKEGDLWREQAVECYEGISSAHKKIHTFTLERDGSNDHCQLDNRSRGAQVMFDWFDEVLGYSCAG